MMVSLDRSLWHASLQRVSTRERGTLITVRYQESRGEPGLVAIWRLPLVEIFLNEGGLLVITAGEEFPVTFHGDTPARLRVKATPDRQHLQRLRIEFQDGSATTVEFVHE